MEGAPNEAQPSLTCADCGVRTAITIHERCPACDSKITAESALEPVAVKRLGTDNSIVLQLSAAISLKRIADVLEGLTGVGPDIENIAERAGQAFELGRRGR